MTMSAAEDIARAFAEALARAFAPSLAQAVSRELQGISGTEWIDQHESELPARTHCAAARRRLAEGLGGAEIVGRRHLLTRAAMLDEMTHCPKPGLRKALPRPAKPGKPPAGEGTLDRLRAIRARQKKG